MPNFRVHLNVRVECASSGMNHIREVAFDVVAPFENAALEKVSRALEGIVDPVKLFEPGADGEEEFADPLAPVRMSTNPAPKTDLWTIIVFDPSFAGTLSSTSSRVPTWVRKENGLGQLTTIVTEALTFDTSFAVIHYAAMLHSAMTRGDMPRAALRIVRAGQRKIFVPQWAPADCSQCDMIFRGDGPIPTCPACTTKRRNVEIQRGAVLPSFAVEYPPLESDVLPMYLGEGYVKDRPETYVLTMEEELAMRFPTLGAALDASNWQPYPDMRVGGVVVGHPEDLAVSAGDVSP